MESERLAAFPALNVFVKRKIVFAMLDTDT